jgi:hypothetical protein
MGKLFREKLRRGRRGNCNSPGNVAKEPWQHGREHGAAGSQKCNEGLSPFIK